MINFETELLPHQKVAFDKLKGIKIGALYMEQGTGKTRTTLELINYRLERGKIEKVLWLCPCSTKQNLRNEIVKHTGQEYKDLIEICGIETLSSSVRTLEKLEKFVDENKVFIVIDESLLVKNFFAKRTQNIVDLAAKCPYRVILNGTPISKNESDLFAQWYILDWRILGYKSYYSFSANHIERDQYGNIRQCLNVDYLTDKLSPYTFQVSKDECVKLPQKRYRTAYFDLTEEQEEIYAATYSHFLPDPEKGKTEVYKFFAAMSDVLAGLEPKNVKDAEGELHIHTTPIFKNPLDNPRMQTLLENVPENEKTIIFARFTHEIEEIIKALEDKFGAGCCVRFDGAVSLKTRAENMSRFQNEENVKYFIANKTCAGYGLNLQFCNNIIFYNNDWNLGTRLQAEDRVHRIGQEKDVWILDIACRGTLDEAILGCLQRKENLLGEINSLLHGKNKDDFKNAIKKIVGVKEE